MSPVVNPEQLSASLYLKHMHISDFRCSVTACKYRTSCCILTKRHLVFLLYSKDKVVYTYRLLKTHSGEYTIMVSHIRCQRNAESFNFSCSKRETVTV